MLHTRTLVLTALFGCGPGVDLDAELFAIGDSYLAWNREDGGSIPEIAGKELGLTVENISVSGAQMLGGPEAIPDQYVSSTWDWVVIGGGGNDVNDECACNRCEALIGEILAPDARAGVLVDLVDRAIEDGAQVALVGYGEIAQDAEFGFDRCGEELETISQRWTLLAEERPEVLFVDFRTVILEEDRSLYDDDRVHPSLAGSAAAGAALAAAIRDATETR